VSGGEIALALGMGMSVEAGGAASRRGVAYGHGLGITQGAFKPLLHVLIINAQL